MAAFRCTNSALLGPIPGSTVGSAPRASWWRSGSINRSSEVNLPASIDALEARLGPRLSEAARTWLAAARSETGRDGSALGRHFPTAARKVGHALLLASPSPEGVRLSSGGPELARMLFAYVTEREHAGRSVGADLWPLIALHPPPGAVERIRSRLAAGADPDARRLLEVALARAER